MDIICFKLDLFLEFFENISWIKIDVEGHEMEVLKGMMEIIKLYKPNIVVENDDVNIIEIQNYYHHSITK
jgi:FkbM family methyltransferase